MFESLKTDFITISNQGVENSATKSNDCLISIRKNLHLRPSCCVIHYQRSRTGFILEMALIYIKGIQKPGLFQTLIIFFIRSGYCLYGLYVFKEYNFIISTCASKTYLSLFYNIQKRAFKLIRDERTRRNGACILNIMVVYYQN